MLEVLVNFLVNLAQEQSVVRRTDRPDMTIAVDWDVKTKIVSCILLITSKVLHDPAININTKTSCLNINT